jgi:toxin YoeB
MGKYHIVFEALSQKQIIQHYKSGDKATVKKLKKILEELPLNPKTGTGQPEQLKHELTGYWSRRINKKDRLIYKVVDEIVTVFIISAMGHYSEK